MGILLDDEEIVSLVKPYHRRKSRRAVAQAQLKKVYNWGEGYCMKHPGSLRRHSCFQCWQALLKEIEEE